MSLPPPDADITGSTIGFYEHMNASTDESHSQPTVPNENIKTEGSAIGDNSSSHSLSGAQNSFTTNASAPHEQLARLHIHMDQRIDRLEKLTCTVFDAIRQLSQQVYSVDIKLADILTNGIPGISVNMGKQDEADAEATYTVGSSVDESSTTTASNQNDSSRRLSWNERLGELKRYKESNGHCDVPQVYDSGLGTWVSAQRSQHKRFTMGKTSSMTKQRKKALENLGFSWSLRKRYSWDERFAELRAFSEENQGSCKVPNDGIYKQLWAWCLNQRHGYKNGLVPGERIAMMQRIGFCWDDSVEIQGAEVHMPPVMFQDSKRKPK